MNFFNKNKYLGFFSGQICWYLTKLKVNEDFTMCIKSQIALQYKNDATNKFVQIRF